MAQNVREYNTGDTIFKERDKGEEMYVLIEGAVELRKKVETGEQLLKCVNKPNDFFGEMALIDGNPRSAAAVAVQPTKLLVIDRPSFENMVVSNGKFALKIIKILSERIRMSNIHISELASEIPRERCFRGMVDYAVKHGEEIFNGGLKVSIAAMSQWVNSHMGVSKKEIANCLYRLVKVKEIDYAPTSATTKEEIVLPPSFVERHDRRMQI
jgi:CRP/FNR family transcriptional regulator, cyclic AMP receptor protein